MNSSSRPGTPRPAIGGRQRAESETIGVHFPDASTRTQAAQSDPSVMTPQQLEMNRMTVVPGSATPPPAYPPQSQFHLSTRLHRELEELDAKEEELISMRDDRDGRELSFTNSEPDTEIHFNLNPPAVQAARTAALKAMGRGREVEQEEEKRSRESQQRNVNGLEEKKQDQGRVSESQGNIHSRSQDQLQEQPGSTDANDDDEVERQQRLKSRMRQLEIEREQIRLELEMKTGRTGLGANAASQATRNQSNPAPPHSSGPSHNRPSIASLPSRADSVSTSAPTVRLDPVVRAASAPTESRAYDQDEIKMNATTSISHQPLNPSLRRSQTLNRICQRVANLAAAERRSQSSVNGVEVSESSPLGSQVKFNPDKLPRFAHQPPVDPPSFQQSIQGHLYSSTASRYLSLRHWVERMEMAFSTGGIRGQYSRFLLSLPQLDGPAYTHISTTMEREEEKREAGVSGRRRGLVTEHDSDQEWPAFTWDWLIAKLSEHFEPRTRQQLIRDKLQELRQGQGTDITVHYHYFKHYAMLLYLRGEAEYLAFRATVAQYHQEYLDSLLLEYQARGIEIDHEKVFHVEWAYERLLTRETHFLHRHQKRLAAARSKQYSKFPTSTKSYGHFKPGHSAGHLTAIEGQEQGDAANAWEASIGIEHGDASEQEIDWEAVARQQQSQLNAIYSAKANSNGGQAAAAGYGTGAGKSRYPSKCWNCQKIGHLARDCRAPPRQGAGIAAAAASHHGQGKSNADRERDAKDKQQGKGKAHE